VREHRRDLRERKDKDEVEKELERRDSLLGLDRLRAHEQTLTGCRSRRLHLMTDHRQLGVDLFNHTWTLLEKESRTPDEDEEMVHAAHASAYHWLHAEGAAPENRARSDWQLSRVYAVVGRGEPALEYAQRCLDRCLENGIGDWDLAFAYEALARAHRVAGNDGEFERNLALATDAGAKIDDGDDRALLEKDLAELR